MNNAITVEKLFAGRLFRVPDYQRGYAWDQGNWDDFLEDLDLLPSGKHHYTGTVVLDRVEKPKEGRAPEPTVWDQSGSGHEVFDIVDGQQRLTTIVLLLDAIRRELMTVPEFATLALGTTSAYVRVTSMAGEPLHRLTLNADTDSFWRDSVLSDEPSPAHATNASQGRLADAKAYFADYLREQRDVRGDGYLSWLQVLRSKVTTNLVFVLYEVSTSAEVGVIFEVMNDRGKQLTELEKVKNYLLYLSSKLDLPPHGLDTLVNDAWAKTLSRLMAAGLSDPRNEDQLLRAHWLTVYDPDTRAWEGTASIKGRFGLRAYEGRHDELLRDVTTYVKSLRDAAVAYAEILSPLGAFREPLTTTEPQRLSVERASRRLLRLRATATFLPVLIATRLRFPTEGAHYTDVVDLCERFSFRVYRLLAKYSNSGQSSLFRLGYEIYHGKRDMASTTERLRELILYYSPQKDYEAALIEDGEQHWYGRRGLKYLLYEWEEHLAAGRSVLLSWDKVEQRDLSRTIEHILPQTPTDIYWRTRFDPAARELMTHDLGNLVLTDDNSSYRNKPFPEKRGTQGLKKANGDLAPCYANSILLQERALDSLDDWTPNHVRTRRGELLAWARDRWHVDESRAVSEGIDVDEAEHEEAEEMAD